MESEAEFLEYKERIATEIIECVAKMGCQPILFIGSGLSKRYFKGPSWDELLQVIAERCPLIEKNYAYFKQTLKTPAAVGEEFARLVQEWAWNKGKNQFPAELFDEAI